MRFRESSPEATYLLFAGKGLNRFEFKRVQKTTETTSSHARGNTSSRIDLNSRSPDSLRRLEDYTDYKELYETRECRCYRILNLRQICGRNRDHKLFSELHKRPPLLAKYLIYSAFRKSPFRKNNEWRRTLQRCS